MNDDNVLKFEQRCPPPAPVDDFDTQRALETCRTMLRHLGAPLLPPRIDEACTTLLLINLNDLLMKARAEGRSVAFTDNVDISEGVANVTDLINKLRNAAVHIRSKSHNFGESKFSFNSFYGYSPDTVHINGSTAGCDFEDDAAIYYGQYRFYLRRHAARAIDELSKIYPPLPF